MTGFHVHQLGLMDRAGELALVQPERHTGQASFIKGRVEGQTLLVPVAPAGEFVGKVSRGRATGIKIDVEGAEEVIVPLVIARPEVRFIVFECNPPAVVRSLWRVIDSAHWRLFGLVKSLWTVRLELMQAAADAERYDDLVAARIDETATMPRRISPALLKQRLAPMTRASASENGAAH